MKFFINVSQKLIFSEFKCLEYNINRYWKQHKYFQQHTPQLSPYLAPELYDYSFKSEDRKPLDIYSLGRIIFLLLTDVEHFSHNDDICRKYTLFNLLKRICAELIWHFVCSY